ncbi:MAG: TatD-related deoxyribonuclease [Chthoniobacteraceae bacterium]|nr:TatD-related deoxyribonuclease [Chthoniobacteraceae bacterium]
MSPFCDAHNHLHDERFAPQRELICKTLAQLGVTCCVVNGTRESDWQAVAALANNHPSMIASFGLHPWHVPDCSANWQKTLLGFLDSHPGAGVGEIGLDRWIEPHDFTAQRKAFEWQLNVAAERNLPASIHCLKAWGSLWDILRTHPLPKRGFLLHAYGGPEEMVEGFAGKGAYFSFSPHFLHPRKEKQRALFAHLPIERLLVETDAPDMAPPDDCNAHPIWGADGKLLNHPANIEVAYAGLAEIRGMPLKALVTQVTENFTRLFGTSSPPH